MSSKDPIVVRAEDITPFVSESPHARTLRVLLSPSREPVASGFAFGLVELQPGQSSPAHKHLHEQETWYVIAGQGQIHVGDSVVEVSPRTVVVSPPDTEHYLVNPGPQVLEALFIFSPAGPEEATLGGQESGRR